MIALLDQQHDDIDSLATAALLEAWHHLLNRQWYCVIFQQPGVGTTLHGPFESEAIASKFMKTHLVSAGPEQGWAVVRKLYESNLAEGITE